MEREPRRSGSERPLTLPRSGRWVALWLAIGLLATLPVLVNRAGVEAAYRSVGLVAEAPGRSWQDVLPDMTPVLRDQGTAALLLPVEALADSSEMEAVQASGFPVFLFWRHPPAEGAVDRRMEEARQAGVRVALVGGVGPAGIAHESVGTGIEPAGLVPEGRGDRGDPAPEARLALVEMEGSPVWAELARAEPERAVVVHRIPPSDWEAYQGSGADAARLARYLRAARERQVRVLVVPVTSTQDGSLDLGGLGAVGRALREEGFLLGEPQGLPPFGAGSIERFLMGAAVGAALILAWGTLGAASGQSPVRWAGGRQSVGRQPRVLALVLPAGLGAAALIPQGWLNTPVTGGISGAGLIAFAAAVIFPTWAVLSLRTGQGTGEPGYRRPLEGWLQAFAIALAGGLLVSGLLSSREALLRLDLFRGVKAMHLASPLLVAVALLPAPLRAWLRSWGGTARQAGGGDGKARQQSWLGAGIGLPAALVLVAAVVYYVGRTGNELVPVPTWEREFRDEIEAVLGARPRFKELFGHAALFAGLAVLARPGSSGSLAGRASPRPVPDPLPWLVGTGLLVAGTVGQLSVVNSLSHLHQPLLLTLQRVAYGGLGGLALGVLLAAVARWGLAWWQRWTGGRIAGRP